MFNTDLISSLDDDSIPLDSKCDTSDLAVLIIKGKPAKYPKSYYQFKALRFAWMKSASPNKDMYIKALTESMKEVIELYNLEQDALKDLHDYKE